jgi:hypothetical protein
MLGTVLYGSILQAFAPLAVLALGTLAANPALGVIAIGSSFVGLLPVQFTSFVYLIVVDLHAPPGTDVAGYSANAEAAAEAGRGWIVVFGVLFQELFRVLVAYGLVRAEWYFRRHHQVLFTSRFRLLPCGAAAEVGYATTLSMLQFVPVLDALATMDIPDAYTFYRLDACPQMPYVYFQALSTCFNTISQVVWTACVTAAVAALYGRPESHEPLSSPVPPAARGLIPRPTTLQRNDGLVVIGIVLLLHMFSSCISLVNRDAFDWAAMDSAPGRGCQVSLPLQAVIAAVSVAFTWRLTSIEVVKRVNLDDV